MIALAGIGDVGGLDHDRAVPATPPDGAVVPTSIGTLTLTEEGVLDRRDATAMPAGDVTFTVVNTTDVRLGFDISRFVPEIITNEELAAFIEESRIRSGRERTSRTTRRRVSRRFF